MIVAIQVDLASPWFPRGGVGEPSHEAIRISGKQLGVKARWFTHEDEVLSRSHGNETRGLWLERWTLSNRKAENPIYTI